MKKSIRYPLFIFYLAILALPAIYFFSARPDLNFFAGDFKVSAGLLFPLFGLYALTLVWIQLIIGSSMYPLRKIFPQIQKFHHAQGLFVLLFALVHPLFLVISLGLAKYIDLITMPSSLRLFVWLGELQLLLLIITVLTASLRKISWLQKNWHWIHLANYLVLFSALVHSWSLGSDVTSSTLKYVWIVFGITGLGSGLAKLYRYLKLRQSLKSQKNRSAGETRSFSLRKKRLASPAESR